MAAIIAAAAALALVGPVAVPAAPSYALASAPAGYPTWQDVKNAQANEASARAKIKEIQALLARLEKEVEETQALAEAAGAEYEERQLAFDTQALKTQTLQAQADDALTQAQAAKKRAAQLLSELGKTGGGDVTANLIGSSGSADDLLYRLGAMTKLSERSEAIYSEALRLQKDAEALTAQAEVEKAKLEEYRVAAEEAFKKAQAAAEAAQNKLIEQQENKATLEAQLAVLVEKRKATEADYLKGLAVNGRGAPGAVNPQTGWAKPVGGYISSGYGYRYHPIYGSWMLHNGTDIAGAGCGAPIYAATTGVVTYAGPNGTLGNYIQIAHNDGTSTGYGHIAPGGILVRLGEAVVAGEHIAREGTTGASTGCHLHFITRINGVLTNPVPFMRDRGITLG